MLIQFVKALFITSSLFAIAGLVLCFLDPRWSNFLVMASCTITALLLNQTWNEILEEKAEEAENKFQNAREQNLKKIMEQTDNYLDN